MMIPPAIKKGFESPAIIFENTSPSGEKILPASMKSDFTLASPNRHMSIEKGRKDIR